MSMPNVSCQRIGCRVESCRFHDQNHTCSLEHITVEPKPGGSTGNPADESLCGSYKTK